MCVCVPACMSVHVWRKTCIEERLWEYRLT